MIPQAQPKTCQPFDFHAVLVRASVADICEAMVEEFSQEVRARIPKMRKRERNRKWREKRRAE